MKLYIILSDEKRKREFILDTWLTIDKSIVKSGVCNKLIK